MEDKIAAAIGCTQPCGMALIKLAFHMKTCKLLLALGAAFQHHPWHVLKPLACASVESSSKYFKTMIVFVHSGTI
jgi:hypothetical protein